MADMQVFTLEAANALVPKLNVMVRAQLLRRAEIESRLKSLSELAGDVPEDLSPEVGDAENVRAMKTELLARITQYQDAWKEVELLGAVVKDPRVGLVDFYGKVDGQSVWLCWKYGEPEIGHYHALDEGFSARRPIRHSIRQRLLN
jgi:hypothetical protein